MVELDARPLQTGGGHAWFDGILEGPRGHDDTALQQVVDQINTLGVVEFQLDFDGGRFSLLADDHPCPASRLSDDRRDKLVRGLERLLERIPPDGEVESTLRCTEIIEAEVHETLFGVIGRELRVVARSRPLREGDRQRMATALQTDPVTSSLPFDRRFIPLIGGVVVALTILLLWQGGFVDRLLGASAQKLQGDTGPFAEMLTLEIQSSWGDYRIQVRRGPGYPTTPDAVEQHLERSETTAERAAVNLIADGDAVYLRLEDENGQTMAARSVSLRKLLSREEATIEAVLPGRIGAERIVIALDDGSDHEPE
ncbi:MAG: hypothetical protein ACOCVS_02035 [Planctomycetota bacterium]